MKNKVESDKKLRIAQICLALLPSHQKGMFISVWSRDFASFCLASVFNQKRIRKNEKNEKKRKEKKRKEKKRKEKKILNRYHLAALHLLMACVNNTQRCNDRHPYKLLVNLPYNFYPTWNSKASFKLGTHTSSSR